MSYFFQENLLQHSFILSPEESRHITKSLRLKEGDVILMTDGKGTLAKAILTKTYKESCEAAIVERAFHDTSLERKLHLAIAPTKNPDRIEWLVEKAVEMGVSQISFLLCSRSERKHIDLNRLSRVAVAALKQSKSAWLPELSITSFPQFIIETATQNAQKFIAHCSEKESVIDISAISLQHSVIFLIGPEGDFTPQEIATASEKGFQQVSLGKRTLRTETAGVFVACWFAVVSTNR